MEAFSRQTKFSLRDKHKTRALIYTGLSQMKNHYRTLGLTQTATAEEIKTAYRKLARKFHPDANGGDGYFAAMFLDVKQAYEILSDPRQRAVYDQRVREIIRKKRSATASTQPTDRPRRPNDAPNAPSDSKYNPATQSWMDRVKASKIYIRSRYVFIWIMCLLPFIGLTANGWPGFFAMCIFSGSLSLFLYNLINIQSIDSIRYGILCLLIAPCFA